jgi:putative DNA-invertase from lambdoid prophage Rac
MFHLKLIQSSNLQFCDLSQLIERTQSGLERAKIEGKILGRPSKTNDKQKLEIRNKLAKGLSASQISRDFGVSRGTIINIRTNS